MRSPSDLRGVEPASAVLLAAVGAKQTLEIAQLGSETLLMLDYFGAEVSVGSHLNSSILRRQNPSKAADAPSVNSCCIANPTLTAKIGRRFCHGSRSERACARGRA